MSNRRRFCPVWFAALALCLGLVPATFAAGRRPEPLSEATLIPTELFDAKDAKRFGYPAGLEVSYTRTQQGHFFKLTDPSANAPTAPPGEAALVATPSPGAEVAPALPATAEEPEFLSRVGYLRPTLVTLVFAESAAAAQEMAAALSTGKEDEAQRPANLAVMELRPDAPLAANARVYNREFNLGPKSGGIRRASSIWLSKGSVFVQVDAQLGLKDGEFDARYESLEDRARAVAKFLLGKL